MPSPRQQQQQQQQQPQGSSRHDDARQQVVYTSPRKRVVYYENYCYRQSMCVGTTLLITGLLSVVLQSVSIAAGLVLSTISHGIWCGVMFVITGVAGLAAGVQRTQFTIALFLTLGIVSTMLSVPVFTLSLISAVVNGMAANHFKLPMEALSLCLMMMSLIAATAALWGSILCCLAVCCSRPMILDPSMSTLIIAQQQQPYSYITLAQLDRQINSDNSGWRPAYAHHDNNQQAAPAHAAADDTVPSDNLAADLTAVNHQQSHQQDNGVAREST